MPAIPYIKAMSCAARLNYIMQLESFMTTIKIAPSILASDFTRLGEEVARVLEAGADYIHVDVMDGYFVPNIALGLPVVKSLRKAFPEAFFDVHFMVSRPERYVESFCEAGASLITLHVEADMPEITSQALEMIRNHGVMTGLSVKPKTPIWAFEPWIEQIDLALIMTVEPGFGGQSFMMDMLPKIQALRQRLDECNPNCEIEVDGGITPQTARLVKQAGANVLVTGSTVFGSDDYAKMIQILRET